MKNKRVRNKKIFYNVVIIFNILLIVGLILYYGYRLVYFYQLEHQKPKTIKYYCKSGCSRYSWSTKTITRKSI